MGEKKAEVVKKKRWVFWIIGNNIVSDETGDAKVVATFKIPVSEDEAREHLGLTSVFGVEGEKKK